jgi:hypothetical protein
VLGGTLTPVGSQIIIIIIIIIIIMIIIIIIITRGAHPLSNLHVTGGSQALDACLVPY